MDDEFTLNVELPEVIIYPWFQSITGSWSPDTGLYLLRDLEPEELVDLLWSVGSHVQNTALVELVAHGNPRKAATLARALIKRHPVAEKSIREFLGADMSQLLLDSPLHQLPTCPKEFPLNVRVQYLQ